MFQRIFTALVMAIMVAIGPIMASNASAAGILTVSEQAGGVYTGYAVSDSGAPLVGVTVFENGSPVATGDLTGGNSFEVALGFTGEPVAFVATFADGTTSVSYAYGYDSYYSAPYISGYAAPSEFYYITPYLTPYAYSYYGAGNYANPYYSNGGEFGHHDDHGGDHSHDTYCQTHTCH